MKKMFAILLFASAFICVSLTAFSPKAGWSYNGGSGSQIPVTYNGSQLVIGTLPHAYYKPLRVDWFTTSGTQSVAVYGSTFTPLCNCNFRIGGSDGTYSSSSYYNYY